MTWHVTYIDDIRPKRRRCYVTIWVFARVVERWWGGGHVLNDFRLLKDTGMSGDHSYKIEKYME